jgi:hypothetical protein
VWKGFIHNLQLYKIALLPFFDYRGYSPSNFDSSILPPASPHCYRATGGNALFSVIRLCLLDIGALALVPCIRGFKSSDVCKAEIYAKLAPLRYCAPVQSFCKKKYPNVVAVADRKVERSTTTAATTTTVAIITSATTTTAPITTPAPITTSTTRSSTSTTSRTTTSAKCTKETLECRFLSIIEDGAKTVSHDVLNKHTITGIPCPPCTDDPVAALHTDTLLSSAPAKDQRRLRVSLRKLFFLKCCYPGILICRRRTTVSTTTVPADPTCSGEFSSPWTRTFVRSGTQTTCNSISYCRVLSAFGCTDLQWSPALKRALIACFSRTAAHRSRLRYLKIQ